MGNASSAPPVWKGTQDLVQGLDEWDITASKIVVTTSYKGPYSTCLSQQPEIGAPVEGYGFNLLLTEVKLRQLDGDSGQLDVTLEAVQDPSTLSSDALGASTYETEWAELTKPLETHPNCGILTADRAVNPTTQKPLTWEDWALLTDNDYSAESNGSVNQGSIWTLDQYKSLKEKGVDSYNMAAPIIRRTTEHLYPPDDLGAATDMIQEPPTAANFTNVSGYQWLGGPDRCTKSHRTFVRQTEWVGAWLWDTLLYQSA